jgi:hypothetical protein
MTREKALEAALRAMADHFGPLEDNIMFNDEARNCFALARAALAMPEEGWRPIKTVPQDGTHVLCGRFVEDDAYNNRIRVDWWRSHITADYTGLGYFNLVYWPATHWMPLPQPPREG